MSLMKRISGVFGHTNNAKPAPEPITHRQRLKQRRDSDRPPKSNADEDITAQFATAFEALDQTASGTELVQEICRGLTDESEKLKRVLTPPKKAHE